MVFEKTSWLSKTARSYFLYVGVPRRVTKLFRIEEEHMRCIEIRSPLNEIRKRWYFRFCVSLNLIDLRSRIRILGSEGVYLDENCGTNPSRHLPGPKTALKNQKDPIFGSRGDRAENSIY